MEGNNESEDEHDEDEHEPKDVDDDLHHDADQWCDFRHQPHIVEALQEHDDDQQRFDDSDLDDIGAC
jgi:hypothetical protein